MVGLEFFTIIGNQIEFNRTPDDYYNVNIAYYKKPDALTSTNQTNSIITGYQNIYLYGVLHQVFLWSEDTEESVKYALKFQDAIKGANRADKKARYGTAPTMRVTGVTP